MWYVVQVRVGCEENIRIQCERTISSNVLERCFIPYVESVRKKTGEFISLKKPLFPGYVFLVSENGVELFYKLKQVIGFSSLLRSEEEILSLSEEEIAFLELLGGDKQIIEMSEGIIERGRTKVRRGPLVGQEEKIVKIDRHKRKAWIDLTVGGETKTVGVGLEILEKY